MKGSDARCLLEAGGNEGRKHGIHGFGSATHEQPATGLRIGNQCTLPWLGMRWPGNLRAVAVPVASGGAGHDAVLREGDRDIDGRQCVELHARAQLCPPADFEQVASEAEAGDVGHRMQAVERREFDAHAIELRRVAQHLREKFGDVPAHPLEPANSPTLRTGHKVGRHRIQGISDEFVPSIVKLGELGRILDVWDGDAIVMSQRLANELGIAVGISSGANLLGALEIAHEQGHDACVVTVFCDDNKKYLSTDLCSDEECKEHYQVNQVQLLDFRVIPPPSTSVGAAP